MTLCVMLLWIAIAALAPWLSLSENQALYVFSSEAQVVAGVYGLTLTGYIFLRNQQDRLADKDESLTEIFEDIQQEQFRLIAFITVVSVLSVLCSLLAIVCRELPLELLKVVTQNGAAALFVASLGWTGFFVLDAMRPGKVSRASLAIKQELEGPAANSADGPAARNGAPQRNNLEDFLVHFHVIEQLLDMFVYRHLEPAARQAQAAEALPAGKKPANWPKPRIVQAMLAQNLIPESLSDQLLSLIRYKNALVHGPDMTVSKQVLGRVRAAREQLEKRMPAGDRPAQAPRKVRKPD